jgi:hypothetical protein
MRYLAMFLFLLTAGQAAGQERPTPEVLVLKDQVDMMRREIEQIAANRKEDATAHDAKITALKSELKKLGSAQSLGKSWLGAYNVV